jgi:hypothetical protein
MQRFTGGSALTRISKRPSFIRYETPRPPTKPGTPVTTMALGEEGSTKPQPVTTLAVGEEGGTK